MKKDIHPKYEEAAVTCVCGNTFTTRSTLPEIKVEICSACHPFFTGQQKLVDSAGRVERFMKKYGKDYAADEAPEKPAAEAKPADEKPVEAKPADEKPADAKAEEKPAEAAPADDKPAENPKADAPAAEEAPPEPADEKAEAEKPAE